VGEQEGGPAAREAQAHAATDTLLVFDLDNTLVHSRIDFRGLRQALIAALHQAGATDETADALARYPIPELILIGEAHDERTGADLVPGLWRTVLDYETAGMAVATIEEGAAEELARLRARGFVLAVLTNNARPATLEALERFALRHYFDLVVTRDDVPALKPASDGVRHAMAAFDGRVGRTLVIGDSWIDGRAAAGAGAAFLAFQPRPGELESRGVRPIGVVKSLRDLDALDLPALAQPHP
jgi:phosphoglycolate phosphatase